ncbi:MAG: Lipid II:glycine glycyltransferase (Peptidoglycan interpeptide bridge formation enzyme) [Candidatus Methanomarinus sp.]|nr:MAG: Lipid II:glycine glycyltransferase (Peptidoglycan interpeptide bridge formation enzyme) [ANME-2 cluster archaeon]
MDFEIRQLKTNYEKIWDEFVMANDYATFYHQVGWKKVIESTYKHKSYYFFAENNNGEIVGLLPTFYLNSLFFGKRLISVPFAPYGGVCTDHDFIAKALIDEAINLGNRLGVDYCEFRNLNMNNTSENVSCKNDYSTFFLEISNGADYIWNNMNKKIRNMVRKGEKNNLEFEIDSSSDAISKFYEIYSVNMKRLGTPVHDYKFFKEIHKIFPNQVLISKSTLDYCPLSALYLLKFKNILISGWGASIPDFLKYAPNDFIYWNSIKYASENNYLCFDFGRSLSNFSNKEFKNRWGSVEIPLNYCYYPSIKSQSPLQIEYGKFTNIWSKLPLSLAKSLGPKVRGHIP